MATTLREVHTYTLRHGAFWRESRFARKGARVRLSPVEPADADYADAVVATYDARTPDERYRMVWGAVGFQNQRMLAILAEAGRCVDLDALEAAR